MNIVGLQRARHPAKGDGFIVTEQFFATIEETIELLGKEVVPHDSKEEVNNGNNIK